MSFQKPRSSSSRKLSPDNNPDEPKEKKTKCNTATVPDYTTVNSTTGTGEERPYPNSCEICGSRFSSKQNLNNHLMKIPSDKPFKCRKCGVAFKPVACLRKYKFFHDCHKCRLACYFCAKVFIVFSKLQSHMSTHTDENPMKPYTCIQCGKSFAVKFQLKNHLKTHAVKRGYSCDVFGCGHRFTRKDNLKCHMKRHTGERVFICSKCGHGFDSAAGLKAHDFNSHTCDRHHACDQCPMTFTKASVLKRHLIGHTGKRYFKCHDCGLAFELKKQLKQHKTSLKHKKRMEMSKQFVKKAEYLRLKNEAPVHPSPVIPAGTNSAAVLPVVSNTDNGGIHTNSIRNRVSHGNEILNLVTENLVKMREQVGLADVPGGGELLSGDPNLARNNAISLFLGLLLILYLACAVIGNSYF